LLGGTLERLSTRSPELRNDPTPVRDKDDFACGDLAKVGAQPVLELPHCHGFHDD
jgi:hypothetical protein